MPSLYVHVPFCLKKCAYCAFYSLPLTGKGRGKRESNVSSLIRTYLDALAKEIVIRREKVPTGVFSLFIGGGTPTALDEEQLDQLLGMTAEAFSFIAEGENAVQNSAVEKTIEANPGTLSEKKAGILVRHGINRVSLGVQSFNDRILKTVGRIHTAEDVYTGVGLLRKAGIGNLNLDLIFGLPGQTLADWQETLKKAVSVCPEHLSLYALTLEKGTPLAQKYLSPTDSFTNRTEPDLPFLPDDDLQADMYEWAADFLKKEGYVHYEIANFALPGYECRHNLAYWQGKDYIGLGPGAVSCLDGIRTKNPEDLDKYAEMADRGIEPSAGGETENLTREERISEYVILGLRTLAGIDLFLFEKKFNITMQDIYGEIMEKYIERKVLLVERGRLRLNPSYFFVANAILRKFIL